MKHAPWLAAVPIAAAFALGSAQAQDDDYGYEYGVDDYTYEQFETDNYAEDEYGYYDEDFTWTTDDGWYDDWNETGYTAWNDYETAHWGVFGYDDAGDWGLWDW